MSNSASFQNSNTALAAAAAATLATTIAVTASITYYWTKSHQEEQHAAHIWREYERAKMLKEKTAVVRAQAGEPTSGTVLEDVSVDKVFLWELHDLERQFPSARVENVMHNKSYNYAAKSSATMIRSPVLRQASTSLEDNTDPNNSTTNETGKVSVGSHTTPYNKLCTNHECILKDVVRKPNMPTHTVAFVRAGPRRYLHFDPPNVSAAIVTCGG